MVLKRSTVALFLFLSVQQPSYSASMKPSATQRDNRTAAQLEQGIFAEINRVRQTRGLHPLKPSADLQGLARAQGRDMAVNGYIGHVDSRGRDLKGRVKDAKIWGWREVGENVARAFGYERVDDAIVRGWLKSKAHRANIMSGRFESTGVGVLRGKDGYFYAVQIFMRSEK